MIMANASPVRGQVVDPESCAAPDGAHDCISTWVA
jgi:hypothetical protein